MFESASKREHPPSTDSSPSSSLPAKRINMNHSLCSICGLDSGYEQVSDINVGENGIMIICDECKCRAAGFEKLQRECDEIKKENVSLKLDLADHAARLAALEQNCSSTVPIDYTAFASAFASVLQSILPTILDSRFSEFDRKIDQKLEAVVKEMRDSDMLQKNKHCLVVSRLPEKESSTPDALTLMLNQQLLPNLLVPDRFQVAHSFHMGKPLSDGSPRLIKLVFDSEMARDVVKSGAVNLKDNLAFKGVRIRPSLSPAQQDLKKKLEDFRRASFPAGPNGRSPVGFRYEADGAPYLWNFVKREQVPLVDLTIHSRVGSDLTF